MLELDRLEQEYLERDEQAVNEAVKAMADGTHKFIFKIKNHEYAVPFAILHHDMLVSIEKLTFIFLALITITFLMLTEHRHDKAQQQQIEELQAQVVELQQDRTMFFNNMDIMLSNESNLIERASEQQDIIDILSREVEAMSNEIAILYDALSDGVVPNTLNRTRGVAYFDGHRETWYNLDMSVVVQYARQCIAGYSDAEYWIREDGCKMLGPYIMVAAHQDIHPYGSLVETSLGTGIVVDTGTFKYDNPYQIDIATDWKG